MSIKRKNIFAYIQLLAGVLILYLAVSALSLRLDLTDDKRYTVSEQSKLILADLDDVVFMRIYLDGEMPVSLKKFRNSIREKMDELSRISKGKLQFDFRNPSEGDESRRAALHRELLSKGLVPVAIEETDSEGGSIQRMIFPSAIVNWRDREMPLNFFHENTMLSIEENLNLALQNMEYEIINTVRRISRTVRDKIAFIEGHGEVDDYGLAGIFSGLKDGYDIDRINIDADPACLDEYRTVVIAKPLERWSEADKFVLDQYIMSGGRTAWFIDAVHVHEDSLSSGMLTMGFVCEHNLNDQLFNYGVRINSNVIQDLQCAKIKVTSSPPTPDAPPKFSLVPWYYFPLLWTSLDNPITRGVNLVRTQYPGVIDTVGANPRLKKTFLLYSSDKSKITAAPLFISLAEIGERITEQHFNKAHLPVAVLLEGEFVSPFRNRIVSQYLKDSNRTFKAKSENTKMIVVSDGDVIRNEVSRSFDPKPHPLGFDRNTGQIFGNLDFVVNIIDYLTDSDELMNIKNRTVKMRLLDRLKVVENRSLIIVVNTVFPAIAVLLGGIAFALYRRRKYSLSD